MTARIGRRAAEESMKEIVSFMDPMNAIILCAGLGKGTGTGALPVVFKELYARHQVVVSLAAMPRLSEGRALRAERALHELFSIGPTMPVWSEEIRNTKNIEDAWQQACQGSLMIQLELLRELLLGVGEANSDLADFKSVISAGNMLSGGVYKIAAEEKPEPQRIAAALLRNKLLNMRKTALRAKSLMFLFHGEISPEIEDRIVMAVRSRTDAPPDKVEVFPGHYAVQDQDRWIGFLMTTEPPFAIKAEVREKEAEKGSLMVSPPAEPIYIHQKVLLRCHEKGVGKQIEISPDLRQGWLRETGKPTQQRDPHVLQELQEKIFAETQVRPDMPSGLIIPAAGNGNSKVLGIFRGRTH